MPTDLMWVGRILHDLKEEGAFGQVYVKYDTLGVLDTFVKDPEGESDYRNLFDSLCVCSSEPEV